MVQLNATKRTATKISQFTKKYDFYVPGERALLREKKKRLPTYHVDRYIVTIYVQDTVVCPKNCRHKQKLFTNVSSIWSPLLQ